MAAFVMAIDFRQPDARTKLVSLAGFSADDDEMRDGRIGRRGGADSVPVADIPLQRTRVIPVGARGVSS
jgi:hypothetical protein